MILSGCHPDQAQASDRHPSVALACSPSLPSDAPAWAGSYSPPPLLADVHLLDILELSGSQHATAAFLSRHQSTVSRSLRALQEQLALQPGRRSAACRQGRNPCLDLLRQAGRAHRLMHGVLRIGTDPLHQPLLSGLSGCLQQVPSRFRRAEHWAELVRRAVLDAAIVGAYGLETPRIAAQSPNWHGLVVEPLGVLPMQLVTGASLPRGVLLPGRGAAPQWHQNLEAWGLRLVIQPQAAQETAAWLKRMRDRELALPFCPALVGQAWLRDQGLRPLTEQPCWPQPLWLLLPAELEPSGSVRALLRLIRRRVSRAAAMPAAAA